MGFIIYISDFIIPFTIFYIVGYGLLLKENVYDDFTEGAKEGLRVVVSLVPTLIGLMVSIGVVRSSGILDMLSNILRPIVGAFGFPAELVPLVLIKMFSSSAATSLLLDIYKQFGTDSYIGTLASVLMSCSETIFYTLAVYSSAGAIKKSRYIISGALFATFTGVVISTILVSLI